MKRFLILVSIFLGTVILSGCGGSETLSCTKEDKAATGKTITKVDVTFEGEAITTIDMNITMNLKEQYKDYNDQMVRALETQFASYKNKDGVDFKISSKDSEVSVLVKVDTTKTKEEDVENLFGFSSKTKQSKTETQKSLEKEGYTCK